MSGPFEPITLCEEFVYTTLVSDPAVTAEFGDAIYPAFSPPKVDTRHVTHDFAGPSGGEPALPIGRGMDRLLLLWQVNAWEPGADRQALRPGMKAIQVALTGATVAGRTFRMESDDGSRWYFEVDYRGPVLVPADVGPQGVWQRVAGRYAVSLQPAD